RHLAIPDGSHGSARPVPDQVPGEPEEDQGAEEAYVVDPLVACHRDAGEEAIGALSEPGRIGLGEDDPLHAAGEPGRSLDKAWCDHREREGGKREVEGGKAKRGNAEDKPDHSRQQSRDGDGGDDVHLEVVGQDGGRVGAQRHECAVAQRKLPAVTDQDVQAHDRDGQDQRLRPFARQEAADHGRKPNEEQHHDADQPVAGLGASNSLQHHTRLVAALPNRPFGLMIRTTMMIASPTASWRSPPTKGMQAPARLTVTPTMSPPTTAPSGLSIPPRTAAAKAKSSTDCMKFGSRKTIGAIIIAATAPTAEDRPQPSASIELVRTPKSRLDSG